MGWYLGATEDAFSVRGMLPDVPGHGSPRGREGEVDTRGGSETRSISLEAR